MVDESKKRYENTKNADRDNKITTDYDHDINKARDARNNQYHDTNPMIEKEGFLGVDDLDRLRRRKISKIF